MGGSAAGPVGTPATVSGHRLRRRTQTVVNYVEDAYLRDDVSCGSALCASCVPPPGAPPTPLRADATHYLVPDADALVAYLDFLESPSARDVVLLASEAKAAHALGDARVSRAIRALCGDRRGRVKLFPNDHCRATSVVTPARRREILRSLPFDALPSSSAAVAALVHPVLRAAAWYASHAVRGAFPVVVLSDAIRPDRLAGAVPPGVEILDADAYFARFHADDPATTQLYESIVSARQGADEGADEGVDGGAEFRRTRRRVAFAPHLSPSALADGLASGDFLEGAIRVSPNAPDEAVVSTRAGGAGGGEDSIATDGTFAAGDVLIPTRALRNRAFDGDVVAVRLLPASRWVEAKSRSVVEDEPIEDEADDEDEEEDGDAPAASAGAVASPDAVASPSAVASPDDSFAASTKKRRLVPTGEVVGILRARGADHVAIISEADASDLSSDPTRSASHGSVLAIPSDRRAPKLRLRTRRARELLGQRLLVRVDGWRATSRHPDARVLRVLGPAGDADAETAALLARFEIPDAPFTPAALANLPPEGEKWTVSAEEASRRRDMRGTRTMSIDPPGCVDVDDAVSVAALPDGAGWEIGVHIADVSSFVREGTALDLEARERGTTVYLVDRRLDMLPALLSENLASLLAGRDRLATSCVWRVARDMTPLAPPWFGKTVIRSDHQLHYYQAQAIADGAPPPAPEDTLPPDETARVAADVAVVSAFAAARRDARIRAGAVELASAELRFETTADGSPSEVLTKGEVPMMRVVAELMIAANAAVAERVRAAFPSSALLRRHAPPRADGFEHLAGLCDAEGVRLDASTGETLSRSLDDASRASGDPAASELFRGMATRAMSEAQYVSAGEAPPADGGGHAHYGLALEHYTHFTSPIRRYADVVVHRQLHAALALERGRDGWRGEGGGVGEGVGGGEGGEGGEGVVGTAPTTGTGTDAAANAGDSPVPVSATAAPEASRLASASGSLSHASLAPIAAALNERNRASKRAQQRCAELYLLALLRERPMVEPALVHDVRDDGASVFLPRFHVRGAVRLARVSDDGREGAVLPAVRTTWIETDAPAGTWGARRYLRAVPPEPDPNVRLERVGVGRDVNASESETAARGDAKGAPGLRYVDARTGRAVPNAPELRLLTRVWVQMSAEDHLARGPRLVLTLLDPKHPDAVVAAQRVREKENRGGGGGGNRGGGGGGNLRDAVREIRAGNLLEDDEDAGEGDASTSRVSSSTTRRAPLHAPLHAPRRENKRRRAAAACAATLSRLAGGFANMRLADDDDEDETEDADGAVGRRRLDDGRSHASVVVAARVGVVDGTAATLRRRWWRAAARAAEASVVASATRASASDERIARRRRKAAAAGLRAAAARRAFVEAVEAGSRRSAARAAVAGRDEEAYSQ